MTTKIKNTMGTIAAAVAVMITSTSTAEARGRTHGYHAAHSPKIATVKSTKVFSHRNCLGIPIYIYEKNPSNTSDQNVATKRTVVKAHNHYGRNTSNRVSVRR